MSPEIPGRLLGKLYTKFQLDNLKFQLEEMKKRWKRVETETWNNNNTANDDECNYQRQFCYSNINLS